MTRFFSGIEVNFTIETPDCDIVFTSHTILEGPLDLRLYGYSASEETAIKFEVKACKDAGVFLFYLIRKTRTDLQCTFRWI